MQIDSSLAQGDYLGDARDRCPHAGYAGQRHLHIQERFEPGERGGQREDARSAFPSWIRPLVQHKLFLLLGTPNILLTYYSDILSFGIERVRQEVELYGQSAAK